MATIPEGLDPWRLPPTALRPEELERTLHLDALDQVAHATHWLLYGARIVWPECPAHPQAHVWPNDGVWVCQAHEQPSHELAPIGRLARPPRKRQLREDGAVDEIDD